MKKIAVIGAGSWGTALAQTLAVGGNEVCMWARKEEVAQSITQTHRNPRYLTGIVLEKAISATSSLDACVKDAQAVVMVTPSRLTRSFAEQLSPLLSRDIPLILCSKGVEEGTGMVPMQVFEEVLGNPGRLAALSGPNHAEEVVLGISHHLITKLHVFSAICLRPVRFVVIPQKTILVLSCVLPIKTLLLLL